MRRVAPWIVFGLLLAATPALAEEPASYAVESLILEETDLPDGWSVDVLGEDLPAGYPSESDLEELGGEDVDTSDLIIEHRTIRTQEGQLLVLAMVDADFPEGKGAWTQGLKTQAAAHQWTVAAIGHPDRLIIVAGPEALRATLAARQQEVGARNILTLAYERLLSDFREGRPGGHSLAKARDLTKISEKIIGKTPRGRTLLGLVHAFSEEDEVKAEGLSLLKEHVDAQGALKAGDRLRAFAYGILARGHLEKKTTSGNEQALRWLKKAQSLQETALEEARERNDGYLFLRVWGNHLHEMSALARLSRKDEAIEKLDEVGKLGQLLLSVGNAWPGMFEHVWFWNEDLEPLRSDPRFLETIKKYAPDNYDWEKRREALEKAREQREKAKAEREAQKKKDAEKKDGGEDGAGEGGTGDGEDGDSD